jgi:curved DNA-binding protein CbpA
MKIKDYYKILGIPRTASTAEIKDRYYELVRVFHPDKNADDPKAIDRFNEINEAYKNIGNLDGRLKYALLMHQKEEIEEEAREIYYSRKKKKSKK